METCNVLWQAIRSERNNFFIELKKRVDPVQSSMKRLNSCLSGRRCTLTSRPCGAERDDQIQVSTTKHVAATRNAIIQVIRSYIKTMKLLSEEGERRSERRRRSATGVQKARWKTRMHREIKRNNDAKDGRWKEDTLRLEEVKWGHLLLDGGGINERNKKLLWKGSKLKVSGARYDRGEGRRRFIRLYNLVFRDRLSGSQWAPGVTSDSSRH